jgi:hypothetical protein
MNPKTLKIMTWVIVVGCIVILIAWDIFDKIEDPTGITTISWQVWLASSSRPIIAFVVGIVCGHLFWQTPDSPSYKFGRNLK